MGKKIIKRITTKKERGVSTVATVLLCARVSTETDLQRLELAAKSIKMELRGEETFASRMTAI